MVIEYLPNGDLKSFLIVSYSYLRKPPSSGTLSNTEKQERSSQPCEVHARYCHWNALYLRTRATASSNYAIAMT